MSNMSLVGWQSLHDRSHLLVCVYSEALLLGYAGQLHVLGIQLLLHHLLQCLENKSLCVCESQGL